MFYLIDSYIFIANGVFIDEIIYPRYLKSFNENILFEFPTKYKISLIYSKIILSSKYISSTKYIFSISTGMQFDKILSNYYNYNCGILFNDVIYFIRNYNIE